MAPDAGASTSPPRRSFERARPEKRVTFFQRSDSAFESEWFASRVLGREPAAAPARKPRRGRGAPPPFFSSDDDDDDDVVDDASESSLLRSHHHRHPSAASPASASASARADLARVRFPRQMPNGIAVDVRNALIESEGDWAAATTRISRYAQLAREQFEVVNMMISSRRCIREREKLGLEGRAAASERTAASASWTNADDVFSKSVRSLRGAGGPTTLVVAPRLEDALRAIERAIEKSTTSASSSHVANGDWCEIELEGLVANARDSLRRFERDARGLVTQRTFNPAFIVADIARGEWDVAVGVVRGFVARLHDAYVKAVDAVCSHEETTNAPAEAASIRDENVCSRFRDAKAAIADVSRRATRLRVRHGAEEAIDLAHGTLDVLCNARIDANDATGAAKYALLLLRDVLERAAFDFHNLAPHDPACECPRKFLALSSDDESADVGVGVARGGGRDGSSYEWDMKRHGAGALGGARAIAVMVFFMLAAVRVLAWKAWTAARPLD